MDIPLTAIVAVLGVVGIIFVNYKGKLTGFLQAKQEAHVDKQDVIKEQIATVNKDIEAKEQQIKELQAKSEKQTEIIKTIAKSNNEEVKKILETTEVASLIEEFDQW